MLCPAKNGVIVMVEVSLVLMPIVLAALITCALFCLADAMDWI